MLDYSIGIFNYRALSPLYFQLPVPMAGINANQPNPLPAWKDRTPLNLTPPLHNLPQAFDKLLPKFDPGERICCR